jgi:hypothetical protein
LGLLAEGHTEPAMSEACSRVPAPAMFQPGQSNEQHSSTSLVHKQGQPQQPQPTLECPEKMPGWMSAQALAEPSVKQGYSI